MDGRRPIMLKDTPNTYKRPTSAIESRLSTGTCERDGEDAPLME